MLVEELEQELAEGPELELVEEQELGQVPVVKRLVFYYYMLRIEFSFTGAGAGAG